MHLSSSRHLFAVLFSLLVAAAYTVRADENYMHIPHNGPEAVSLPSVDVSEGCKHIDFDFNYSTGRASIVYPLYTVQCGELTLPITISYHTGGVRVDEEPGPVGMSWSLNYGGFISRSVHGLPDNCSTQDNIAEAIREQHVTQSSQDGVDIETLTGISCNQDDAQYDRFQWQAGNESGEFFVTSDEIVHLSPTDCRVYIDDDEFHIFHPDGTEYVYLPGEEVHFSAGKENLATFQTDRIEYTTVSTWRLSRIIGPSACDTIHFEYKNAPDRTRWNGGRISSIGVEGPWFNANYFGEYERRPSDVMPQGEPNFRAGSINEYKFRANISFIRWRGGTVVFNSDDDDTITSITVKAPDGTLIRSVDFTYDTMRRTNVNGQSTNAPVVSSYFISTGDETDSIVTLSYSYVYDNFDRVSSITLHRSDSTVAINRNSYNPIGRISTSYYGNECSLGYAYTTSGAIRSMTARKPNDDLNFEQNLYYTTGDTPSYSGNIGYMSWKGADGLYRRYNYTYDGLNRLVSAAYLENGSRPDGFYATGTRSYSTQYTYGADSRPLTIRRSGVTSMACTSESTTIDFGEVDNLLFTYSGTHLVKVSDTSDPVIYTGAADFNDAADQAEEYTYDANGNMTSDANKNIVSIEYNALNLPAKVTFTDGAKLTNIYSADGTLLRRVMRELQRPPFSLLSFGPPIETELGTRTIDDHIGPLTYRDNALARIDTPNGFISGDEVYYYIKDYQGNIRQVTDADGNVLQDNHYYPYGMLMAESSDILAANRRSTPSLNPSTPAIGSFNPYLFGGKEYIPFKGSNYLDFTARIYDNTILTFGTQDKLREKYYPIHSRMYCAGNPVMFIDPTGMVIEDPEGLIKAYIEFLKLIISNVKADDDDLAIKAYLDEVNHSLEEIYALQDSKQTYYVESTNDKDSGGSYYEKTNKKFILVISSGGGKFENVSHELKHAYQFEMGQISFQLDGRTPGVLTDIYDEVDAYDRSRAICLGREYFDSDGKPSKKYYMGVTDIRNLVLSKGLDFYKDYQTIKLDKSMSGIGLYLFGSPLNIFIGWKKK